MIRTLGTAILVALALATGAVGNADDGGDAAANQAVRAAAESGNAFAWDLFGQLRQEHGNLFFSPFSIHSALAMTWAGARTHTAEEMREVLRLALPPEEMHAALGKLRLAVDADEDSPYELEVANALWGQADFHFHKAFLDLLERDYAAGMRRVDFRSDPEAAREAINAWVAERTRERIQNVVPQDAVTIYTRLALANAIYFKGQWAEQFEEDRTEEAPFYRTPDDTVEAPFMRQTRRFPYAEADGLQVLALPYAGDELDMVVLLPKEKDGLAEAEASLTAEKATDLLRRLRPVKAEVWLPRFTMTCQYGLVQPLAEMGMKDAFTPQADFSGMGDADDLHLQAVVHKAFVEVTEEGTEAAAATVAIVGITSVPAEPPEPVVFRADRPFLFLIRHIPTESILFLGRVADPTEE